MFIDEDIAQNMVASIGGIALFHSIHALIDMQYGIWLIIGGVFTMVFSKNLPDKRLRDIFRLTGGIVLFLGLSPYLLPLIQKQVYIAIIIAVLVIYFAKNIGKLISKGGDVIPL